MRESEEGLGRPRCANDLIVCGARVKWEKISHALLQRFSLACSTPSPSPTTHLSHTPRTAISTIAEQALHYSQHTALTYLLINV